MRCEPEIRIAIRIGDLGLSNLPPSAGFPYLDDNGCRAKPGPRPEAVLRIKATAFKRVVQSMNFLESRGRKKSDAVRGSDRQHGAVRRQRRSLELRGRSEGRYRSAGEIRDPEPNIENAAICPESETARLKARRLSVTSVRGEIVTMSLAGSSNGKQALGADHCWRVRRSSITTISGGQLYRTGRREAPTPALV